jgi:hypothetical protein
MDEERPRKIIHVDMDAFYASVEQRDNPELRGKPVAVGGSRERGVVAAASYEARVFGVRSAMASVTAKRQCPDLIFVKPRFDDYRAVSQQIREILEEHTPIIEPLSLDEAYLDVTENLQNIPLARDVALAIRAKIKAVKPGGHRRQGALPRLHRTGVCTENPKSERNGDEVRPGWHLNEIHRRAVPSERPAHPCSKTDAF